MSTSDSLIGRRVTGRQLWVLETVGKPRHAGTVVSSGIDRLDADVVLAADRAVVAGTAVGGLVRPLRAVQSVDAGTAEQLVDAAEAEQDVVALAAAEDVVAEVVAAEEVVVRAAENALHVVADRVALVAHPVVIEPPDAGDDRGGAVLVADGGDAAAAAVQVGPEAAVHRVVAGSAGEAVGGRAADQPVGARPGADVLDVAADVVLLVELAVVARVVERDED